MSKQKIKKEQSKKNALKSSLVSSKIEGYNPASESVKKEARKIIKKLYNKS